MSHSRSLKERGRNSMVENRSSIQYGEEVVGRKLKIFEEGLVIEFLDNGKHAIDFRSRRQRWDLNLKDQIIQSGQTVEDLIGKKIRVYQVGVIKEFVADRGLHLVDFGDDDDDDDDDDRNRILELDDEDLDWIFSDSAQESFEKKFVGKRVRMYMSHPVCAWFDGTIKSFNTALGSHCIEFDAGGGLVCSQLCTQKFEWIKVRFGREITGKRIRVFRPLISIWYEGVITSFDKYLGKHVVRYTNGEMEMLQLELELFGYLEESREDSQFGLRFNRRFEHGWKVGSIESYNVQNGTQVVQYLNGELEVLQINKHKIEWPNQDNLYKKEVVGKRIRIFGCSSESNEVVLDGVIASYDEELAKHWVRFDNGSNKVLELDYEVIECLSPDEDQGEKRIGRKILIHRSPTWIEAIIKSFDILSGKHVVELETGRKMSIILKEEKYECRQNGEDLVGKKINLLAQDGEWHECVVISFDSGKHTLQFNNGNTEVVSLHLIYWSMAKEPYGQGEVGKKLRVFQRIPHLRCWYGGVVKAFDTNLKKHLIQFEDGSEKTLLLEKEKIQWLEQRYESELVVGKKLRVYCHDKKGWLNAFVESLIQSSNQLLVVLDNGDKMTLRPEKDLIEWVESKELYGEEVVGKKVRIYVPHSKLWFDGRVKSFDNVRGRHTIKYDNGLEVSAVDLEKWKIEWPKEEDRVYVYRKSSRETMPLALTY